jgi:Zn finger protein HypA/HybF involved in hydrogenase expression
MRKLIKKSTATKKLQCRCKNCTNIVEVASTSLSVVCSSCTFKMAEGILEYSK